MHPKRKKRLMAILLLLLGLSIAVGFALVALKQNINLFLTPSKIQQGEALPNQRFRLGGMVKPGSIQKEANSLRVKFIITDYAAEVPVEYEGVLPDLFRENQGVVVSGMLNEKGAVVANEVLAKHDENYMPPGVMKKDMLKGSEPRS